MEPDNTIRKTVTLTKPTWKRFSELKLDCDSKSLDVLLIEMMDCFEQKRKTTKKQSAKSSAV
jgi:hypothetical protein